MGQELSAAANRERQKKSSTRGPPALRRELTPTRAPDPYRDHHETSAKRLSSTSSTSSTTSGYASTNSTKSSSSGCPHHLPIYTNHHYRDVNNNDIYKPLKINKNNAHRLKILNADKETAIYLEKHLSIKSYLDREEAKRKSSSLPPPEATQKKSGIRNYTPKILSEKNVQKDLEHWI